MTKLYKLTERATERERATVDKLLETGALVLSFTASNAAWLDSKPDGFKDIPRFAGLYAVNREGQVYSYPKFHFRGRILRPHKMPNGYLRADLNLPGEKAIQQSIHRLVAETWLENPKNLPQVNHKNGVKTDNRVENLEWCTAKENIQHSFATGLQRKRGSAIVQVDLEGKEIARFPSIREASRKLGIKHQRISNVLNGWGNTLSGYTFKFAPFS